MDTGLIVTVQDAEVQKRIAAVVRNLGPGKSGGLFRAIGHVMRESTIRKFEDEGSPPGSWPGLAESTIRQRRDVAKGWNTLKSRKTKRGRARADEKLGAIVGAVKPLQDTGSLKRSIHALSDDEHANIGTNQLYGIFHQEGTGDIPERPFLLIDAQDAARIERLALNYLAEALQ